MTDALVGEHPRKAAFSRTLSGDAISNSWATGIYTISVLTLLPTTLLPEEVHPKKIISEVLEGTSKQHKFLQNCTKAALTALLMTRKNCKLKSQLVRA